MNQESSSSRLGIGILCAAAVSAVLFVACGGNGGNKTDPCAPNGKQVGEQCLCDPGFVPVGLTCLALGGGGGGGGGGGNDGGGGGNDAGQTDGGMTDPDGGQMDPDGGMTGNDGGMNNDGGVTCGPSNCSTCCINNACVSQSNNLTCGSGGNVCQTCTGSQQCMSGTCQNTACNGCVTGAGTCLSTSQQSNSQCGANGNSCVACPGGSTCQSGACVPTTPTCGPGNCNGCCQGNTCVGGTTTSACGAGGNACTSCSGSQTCQGGVCTTQGTNCFVPSSFGVVTGSSAIARGADGGTYIPHRTYQTNINTDPDILQIQIYAESGTVPTLTAPSTHNLANEAPVNYATCGACVLIQANATGSAPAAVYMAESGTLSITSYAPNFSGTLTNATFVRVQIDPNTLATTVINDGCATAVSSHSFSSPVQAPQ